MHVSEYSLCKSNWFIFTLASFFENTLKYDEIIWCGGWLALLGFVRVSAWVKGVNLKCANVGRLKLFFKMCVGKIFKPFALVWMSINWSSRCRVTVKLSTEFLSPESKVRSQKSGRFGVHPMVALLCFRLGYNGLRLGEGGDFTIKLSYEAHTSNLRKTVTRCLNRHFFQTAVRCCPSSVCQMGRGNRLLARLRLCGGLCGLAMCLFRKNCREFSYNKFTTRSTGRTIMALLPLTTIGCSISLGYWSIMSIQMVSILSEWPRQD